MCCLRLGFQSRRKPVRDLKKAAQVKRPARPTLHTLSRHCARQQLLQQLRLHRTVTTAATSAVILITDAHYTATVSTQTLTCVTARPTGSSSKRQRISNDQQWQRDTYIYLPRHTNSPTNFFQVQALPQKNPDKHTTSHSTAMFKTKKTPIDGTQLDTTALGANHAPVATLHKRPTHPNRNNLTRTDRDKSTQAKRNQCTRGCCTPIVKHPCVPFLTASSTSCDFPNSTGILDPGKANLSKNPLA